MSDAVRFLTGLAQSLATMTLYDAGHPARERNLDGTYQALCDLQAHSPRQVFTFMGNEVLHGSGLMRELRNWEWSERLVSAGVQRLEVDEPITREELLETLEEVMLRLSGSRVVDSPELRSMRRARIRVGAAEVRARDGETRTEGAPRGYSLQEEVRTIQWMQREVEERRSLPLLEAEAVVRSLTVAMHGDSHLVLPLLRVRDYDAYTTSHSMNVAVLSMALAESMALPASDVRAYGIAGLLLDIGKLNVPRDILNKPGRLTPEERATINRHPLDGARMLMESERNMEMAAVVAYEHHLRYDGGGYPRLHYRRLPHPASRLAHLCDVYDALRTQRPYRPAWSTDHLLESIEERAGTEFDPEVTHAFLKMMKDWEPQLASYDGEAPEPGAHEAFVG
jgi:putative nucleotidyltransferase with HDIG domain